jgi:branched-chain amino acid transport system ATP-binding protein
MLEINDLHSYYGDAHILRGVNMKVPKGKVVALLGRNGMGKTTLIRSIMGLNPPRISKGSIQYDGHELVGLSPHVIAGKRIGFVPQGRRLFASLSVTEHLTVFASKSPSSLWTVKRIYELFPRLEERKNNLGTQLSGGERQMLAVARALMTDPEMLLMDEPTEGLAPVMVQHLEEIVAELGKTGLGILLVEQNANMALNAADRGYVLENGRIVMQDTCERLREKEDIREFYLGIKEDGVRTERRWKKKKTWR